MYTKYIYGMQDSPWRIGDTPFGIFQYPLSSSASLSGLLTTEAQRHGVTRRPQWFSVPLCLRGKFFRRVTDSHCGNVQCPPLNFQAQYSSSIIPQFLTPRTVISNWIPKGSNIPTQTLNRNPPADNYQRTPKHHAGGWKRMKYSGKVC